MKTTEKTAANEPLVLATFVACLTEALMSNKEEQRVLAVVASAAKRFDGKLYRATGVANGSLRIAVAESLPEYVVRDTSHGKGIFHTVSLQIDTGTWMPEDRITTVDILRSEGRIDAARTCGDIENRLKYAQIYMRDYENALNNAEALVSLHNRALDSMKSFHTQIGTALTAVQKYFR